MALRRWFRQGSKHVVVKGVNKILIQGIHKKVGLLWQIQGLVQNILQFFGYLDEVQIIILTKKAT